MWSDVTDCLSTPERPLPSNSDLYTPASAMKHICSQPTPYQTIIVDSVIRKGQVPVKKRRMQSLIKRSKEGKADLQKGWKINGFTGCPPIATIDEILDKVKNVDGVRGHVKSTNDISQIMNDINMEKKGISAKCVSRRTVAYTKNWVKGLLPGVKKVQHKKTTRIKSEKSIRSVITYLHTIATTHYWINNNKGSKDPASLQFATDESKNLYHMISELYGGACLSCVHPDLLLSTDDSAIFACKISHSNENNWFLLFDDDVDTSSQSLHSSNNNDDSNGFRSGVSVRMTHTMSASGRLAPVFCQVMHLTERELSVDQCPSGIALLEIPGLCVGSAVDPRNKNTGFVVLVRQGVDESLIFDHYTRFVFIPHVKALIKRNLEFDNENINTNLPDDLTVISWKDGGQAQMRNELSEDVSNTFHVLKIVSNKHNAARSAREQPCDLASLFRTLRQRMKFMLGSSFSNDNRCEGMMTTIKKSFQDARLNHGLELGKKQSIIQSFLVCLPEALSRSARQESIVKGFERSGLLDTRSKMFPCVKGIVDTLSRNSTKEDYEVVTSTFRACFQEQCEKGELTPTFLDTFQTIPRDENEALRDTNVLIYQRSKTINHIHQKHIRRLKLLELNEKKCEVEAEQRDRNVKALYVNEKCEKQLHKSFLKIPKRSKEDVNPISYEDLQKCTEAEFNLCNNDFIKGFIVARTYENVPKQIPSEKVPTRKPQRVLTALKLKCKQILLKKVTEEVSATPEPGTNRRLVFIPEIIIPRSTQKPSYFLKKASWRVLVCETMKGVVLMEPDLEVCQQTCDEADGCFELINTQFDNIFLSKNAEDKSTHYCFLWVSKNISLLK